MALKKKRILWLGRIFLTYSNSALLFFYLPPWRIVRLRKNMARCSR